MSWFEADIRALSIMTRTTLPKDLQLQVAAGGNLPYSGFRTLAFFATGLCTITDEPLRSGEPRTIRHLFLTPAVVAQILERLRKLGFAKVRSRDSGAIDGDRVQIALTASGRTREVVLRNASDRRIDTFVRELNELLPPEANLAYNALDHRIDQARRRWSP